MSASSRNWQQLAAKGSAVWDTWLNHHEQAASLLGTAGNILDRLEALQQPTLYGDLAGESEVQEVVLAKQLQAFDVALLSIHGALSSLAATVRDFERLAAEAARLMQASSRGAASWVAALECRGAEPSAVQVCELLQDASVMCRDELLLQQAVVALVGYSTKPQEMQALLSCFRGRPNVDADRVNLFFHQVSQVAASNR